MNFLNLNESLHYCCNYHYHVSTKKNQKCSEQLKKEICINYQENIQKTHQEIANYFSEKNSSNINRSSVTKILHDKEKWINASATTHTFCHRQVRFSELEKAMNIWIGQVSASGLTITVEIIYNH